ncbi:MAG: SpoIIIAH-like family protein [Clostridia bacterium]|nr:SpoIIIAH-like family protein [Clostridia bacterium]
MKKKYKNQIIIYVIAFMLVTAGYLNYTEKKVVEVSSEDNQNRTDENIGDAKLVNSDDTSKDTSTIENEKSEQSKKENKEEEKSNQEKDNSSEKQTKTNENDKSNVSKNEEANKTETKDKSETNNKDVVTTSSKEESTSKTNTEYFTSSKLERENMYSQMLENYQKMLNNSNISEEQKSIASQEIKSINNIKNSIMICENLITTKGFEKVVIFVNGESINVVVKSEKLSQEQVAQIQNIVTREMNTKTENIHIMTH